MSALDALHHVAIQVEDLDRALDWYRQHFRLEVVYRDPTWLLLRLANIHLALVIPTEHPPHLALSHPDAARFGALTTHRDGTRSVYIEDSEGNTVEIMQAEAAP
ncbi:MAG TPA: VOC family protein [Thioalkalivibrio sp.]|nr:VOC family protein [Thioalkalivibrio sp.]